MPHTDFEEGLYAIASAKIPKLVLDVKDGKVIGNQFMGSESQQWKFRRVLGIAWSIQNLPSGRYLGMKPDDKITNGYQLSEVDHPFAWHLNRGDPKSRIFISVPHTSHVIDIYHGEGINTKPGSVAYIYDKHGGLFQQWNLCKDLHLATAKALKDGSIYRIINSQSKTAVEMNGGKVACFKSDGTKGCQKFVAVETQNGWAFRHLESQKYLGLHNSVIPLPDGERLRSAQKEFSWVPLPHHEDMSKFKIWIPFTSKVMDLHCGSNKDDTPIHLYPECDPECQWWRFEIVHAVTPDPDRRDECTPGAPER